jgi:dolichyl-phosphate-mannose--protein O-mannosyl transferase
MLSKIFKPEFFIALILSLCLLTTRLIKINWGDGFFYNPDENNMASAISQMKFEDLNPHFFAYGQFPLYLTFFTIQLSNLITNQSLLPQIDFSQAVITLRIWSAAFSVLTSFFLYLISKNIFEKKDHRLIFLLLVIFTPGLIQMSHFGTTESILLFVFVFNIFISQKIYQFPKFSYLFLAAFVSGIGVASKVSALILTTPIFLAFLLNFIKRKKIFVFLISCFAFLIFTLAFSALLSPYNLISSSEFLSIMKYEIGVATGSIKVFYTSQFINSKPYLFQLTKIFPYISGFPVFVFAFLGIFFVIKSFFSNYKYKEELLLIMVPSLVYFLYQGQLYVKWVRFVSSIFFIFPFLATFFIIQFKNKFMVLFLTLISVIPGLLYLNLYLIPDVRTTASEWITKNIPESSNLLSEGGNVVNLPVHSNFLSVNNFNFYELDKNQDFKSKLPQSVYESDYILIPSRRIFKNQNNNEFPVSQKYYQNLFSGKLGFEPIKTFSIKTNIFQNPENAEETWTVFDNPTIRVFKKTESSLTLSDYQKLIN